MKASPFHLGDDAVYRDWRAAKLAAYPKDLPALQVPIRSLVEPTASERQAIRERCAVANMALYTCADPAATDPPPAHIAVFAGWFAMTDLETHRSAGDAGVVSLEVSDTGTRRGYIPYTDKPLGWHTDGYYNAIDRPIRSFVLHCVRPAERGGESALLDPEIAYIRLRDRDPAFISALMHPSAMIIPPNTEPDGTIRPERVGPVFAVDSQSGALHMRYSARPRNIIWRDDPVTTAARHALLDLLDGAEPLVHRLTLQAGQGLICNNVLHRRSGFSDQAPGGGRLLYRLRCRDRVARDRLPAHTADGGGE